ncbi:MAG: hypothetical protein C5B43_03500 [Verrucomicrobia bacterium]|nr:MAG: hypothetical protein C5B43_03500 [Verrucomicrobiota bacterium]
MAQVTFINTQHSASTNPTKIDLNSAGDGSTQQRIIKKIIVGKPTGGKTVKLYHMDNAYFNESSATNSLTNRQVAFMYTYPTFAAGTPATDTFDFTSPEGAASATAPNGLVLSEGGSMETDAAMQVTVIWENPEA